MTELSDDSGSLVTRAAAGDIEASRELFGRYRERLKRMVAVRIDPRLVARLDPSDIVQEALLDATRKLPRYSANRPLPFYPWLRQLALERLIEVHRRHVLADKRDPEREENWGPPPADSSLYLLADWFLQSSDTGPMERAILAEEQRRALEALDRLAPDEREVLVLRYLEQLSIAETADALGISQSAVKMRHLRALERIRGLLDGRSR